MLVNLREIFEKNLRMAQEDNPLMDRDDLLKIALEWSESQVVQCLVRVSDENKWGHIDAVNKAFCD